MSEVWADLKTVRLNLSDPSGVIDLDHVASVSALPASPKRQTAYREDDTGIYKIYDSGLLAWKEVDLKISDESLNSLIEANGTSKATVTAIVQIIGTVLDKMRIVNFNSGTEATQYQTLQSVLDFYKTLKDLYTEEASKNTFVQTGRMMRTRPPTIGGVSEYSRWYD